MVNFSCATPWLLHASLFSRKDDIVREHPPCELRIGCVSRIRTAHSPDVRGMCRRRNEKPAALEGGRRASVQPYRWGVRNGCAAGGLMAGALQGIKPTGARKGQNRRVRAKGKSTGAPQRVKPTGAPQGRFDSGRRSRSPPHRARRKASAPPCRTGPTSLCWRRPGC